MNHQKNCVYTCLIGNYEKLNELRTAADSQIPRFCFTDNELLTSETWTIRLVSPAFPMDSVRSQRRIKILAHEYLPDFEASLYVDNTVGLKVTPESLFEQYFQNVDIAVPRHSFRETVQDEFLAVARDGLDEPSRIFEQLNHYQLAFPRVLDERPYWSAILLRQHHRPQVRQAMINWYNQVMRYSRRDQLSLNAALVGTETVVRPIVVDNAESEFHEWPIASERDLTKRLVSFSMAGAPLGAQLKSVQLDLGQANSQLAERERVVADLGRHGHELSQQVAALNARLDQANAEVTALRGDAARLHGEGERARAEADHARAEFERARLEAAIARAETEALRKEGERVRASAKRTLLMKNEDLETLRASETARADKEAQLRISAENELKMARASLRNEQDARAAIEASSAWRASQRAAGFLSRHRMLRGVARTGAKGALWGVAKVRRGRRREDEFAQSTELDVVASSSLFDRSWYLSTYPDVAAAGVDPVAHYLGSGAAEGRDPSLHFSTSQYLSNNPDVAATGINPLLHYEQFGKREGRLLGRATGDVSVPPSLTPTSATPCVSDVVFSRFPALKPLPTFRVPSDRQRVTLITDSINAGSLFGGVGTALVFGALFARHLGAKLRIITRAEAPEAKNFDAVLKINKISWKENVEFLFVPYGGSVRVPTSNKEIFLTTSWWSTECVRQVADPEQIVYLLQEDERMFYAAGDERLRCAEVLSDPDIRFVINTKMLYEHLTSGAEPLPNVLSRGAWFEPSFPSVLPKAKNSTGKRRFFFYARPNNLRNLYFRGLEVIQECLSDGVLNGDDWEFHFAGKDISEVELPGGVIPTLHQNMPWAEYVALVQNMDVGLSLMDTPHPSYPPLDLAASGAVVVTSTHGLKTSLEQYSRNIICAAPTVAALKRAIALAVSLSADNERREANLDHDMIGRDWESSFASVLARMSSLASEDAHV